MVRIVVAVALALHGLIHIIGFLVPWRLLELRDVPYSTAAAWGRIDLGDAGARVLGLGWLLGTLAFLMAAIGVWQGAPWGVSMTAAAAALSLLLCVAGSPAAVAGLIIDVVVLCTVLVIHLTGWGPTGVG